MYSKFQIRNIKHIILELTFIYIFKIIENIAFIYLNLF